MCGEAIYEDSSDQAEMLADHRNRCRLAFSAPRIHPWCIPGGGSFYDCKYVMNEIDEMNTERLGKG